MAEKQQKQFVYSSPQTNIVVLVVMGLAAFIMIPAILLLSMLSFFGVLGFIRGSIKDFSALWFLIESAVGLVFAVLYLFIFTRTVLILLDREKDKKTQRKITGIVTSKEIENIESRYTSLYKLDRTQLPFVIKIKDLNDSFFITREMFKFLRIGDTVEIETSDLNRVLSLKVETDYEGMTEEELNTFETTKINTDGNRFFMKRMGALIFTMIIVVLAAIAYYAIMGVLYP